MTMMNDADDGGRDTDGEDDPVASGFAAGFINCSKWV